MARKHALMMLMKNNKPTSEHHTANGTAAFGPVDIESLARNMGRAVEEGGKALAAYLRPREDGRVNNNFAEEVTDAVNTLGHLAEYWLSDPQRTLEAQASLATGFMSLWTSALQRMAGEEAKPAIVPDARDSRFRDPEWSENQYFDLLKQAYLITSQWADKLVKEADGLEPHLRHKADLDRKSVV